MSYSVNTNTEEEIVVDNSISYEMIRIEVLDCRSGLPLANKQVKKLIINKDDDQAINVDFDKDEGQKPVDSYRTALSRLGFNEGLQNDRYINYWQSRAEGTTVLDGDEPMDDFTARIIEEYNLHRATDANGILNLQIPRNFFDGHAVSVEVGFWDFPVFLEAINGDPRTQSGEPPRQPLEPIRRNEEAIGRPYVPENTNANGTQFNIVWTGRQQSTEWNGNWGWEAQKTTQTVTSTNIDRILPILSIIQSEREVSMATEFKVSETMVLKSSQKANKKNHPDNLSILNEDIFSIYHTPSNNSPHFVLFGMQWCQPVWDGIEDPQGELVAGSCNGISFIKNPDYANLNMHIVSDYAGTGKHNGQTVFAGGKEYGTTRHEVNAAHDIDSIDLMTGAVGDLSMFAIHSGTGTRAQSTGTGLYITLECNNPVFGTEDKIRGVRYLHLDSFIIDNNTFVMTGQELGRAGRTGFSGRWPDHCHMDYGPGADRHSASILNHRSEVDRFNQVSIPHYDLPLILPCRIERGNSISSCGFDCDTAENCWAAIELKCHALANRSNAASDNQQVRVIQAQLRFLGYYTGGLDGDNGNGTKAAIAKYKAGDTSGITGNYSFFVDGIIRPVPVSTENEYRINGHTRSEAFDAANEVIYDDRGNLVVNDTTGAINALFLEWLNLEAPLPSYGDNSIIL